MALGPTLQKKVEEYKLVKAKIVELQAKDGTLTHEQAFKLAKKALFHDKILKVDALLATDFSEIEKKVMAAMAVPPGLVDPKAFYDYDGLLQSPTKDQYEKLSKLYAEAKEIAKKQGKPLLLSTPTSKPSKFDALLSPPGGEHIKHEGTVTGKMTMPGIVQSIPKSAAAKAYYEGALKLPAYVLPPSSQATMLLSVNYLVTQLKSFHLEQLKDCVGKANISVAYQLALNAELSSFFKLSFDHEFDYAHKKLTLAISGEQPAISALEKFVSAGFNTLIHQMAAGEKYHLNSFAEVIAYHVVKALYKLGVPGKYPATINPPDEKQLMYTPVQWKKDFDKALITEGSATLTFGDGSEPEVVPVLVDVAPGVEYKFHSGSLVTGTEGKPIWTKKPAPAPAPAPAEQQAEEPNLKTMALSPLAAMGFGVEE